MIRLASVPIQGRWVGFSTHRRRASLLTRCVCVAALNLAASVASAAGAAAREPRRVAAASRVTGRLSPLHMQLIPLIASELSLPTMYYFLYTRSCSASAVAFRSDDRLYKVMSLLVPLVSLSCLTHESCDHVERLEWLAWIRQ